MPTSICPECSEEVYVELETEQGDRVVCDECGADLVVVGLDPVELDLDDGSLDEQIDDSDDLTRYDFDDGHY